MSRYYLAIDAGGSKVHLLLFDDAYRRIDFDVAASSNPNVNPIPEIISNMHKTFERMFVRNPQIRHLTCVYLCALCPAEILLSPLKDLGVDYGELYGMGEGEMGMFANGISGSAVIVLSGTGSDVHIVKENKGAGAVGGWGAIVADEGSGYWIGREALVAAVHDDELRGGKALITGMIREGLYPNDLQKSVFAVYESSSPARSVAAMSRLVDAAAREGDRIAIDILCRAARLLAEQVRTVYLKYPECYDFPLLVTGGSWKNILLFSQLEREIEILYPEKRVKKPLFEPIVGGVFCHAVRMGLSDEQAREILLRNFSEDLYLLPEQ